MSRMSASNVVCVVLPAVCVIGGGLTMWWQYRRIANLSTERVATERSIAIMQQQLAASEGEAPPMRIATMEMTPKEQVDFLYSLRAYAAATRVRLVSWTNGTPMAPAAPGGKEQAASTLPAGVNAISSAITVSGTYANVREFLYYLLRSPRLLSMSDMRWARGDAWPVSSVSFTLTRYVTPPLPTDGVSGQATEGASGSDLSAVRTGTGAAPGVPGTPSGSPATVP